MFSENSSIFALHIYNSGNITSLLSMQIFQTKLMEKIRLWLIEITL